MVTEGRLCLRISQSLQAVQLFPEEVGLDLKDTTMEQLGRAKSVKVQKRKYNYC